MFLSICIPTYNRSQFLERNIQNCINAIDLLNASDEIEIIVSDNNSIDDTILIVQNFINKFQHISIRLLKCSLSILPQENLINAVENAKGIYFLWCGDDDYFSVDYLGNALRILKEMNIGCILPSYIDVDINGKELSSGRDLGLPNRFYEGSFKNCLKNSYRGHQMSGLIFKRKYLQAYHNSKTFNLYPQIFFSGLSCLKESHYHLTEYPIKVTQPGQENKAWSYGKTGLLEDVFENYNKLPINHFQIGILQIYFFYKQPWRLWQYKKNGLDNLLTSFFRIWFIERGTFMFKCFFPLIVFYRLINRKYQ